MRSGIPNLEGRNAVNKRQESCTLMGGNQISFSLFQRVLSFHFETVVLLDCFIAYYRHFILRVIRTYLYVRSLKSGRSPLRFPIRKQKTDKDYRIPDPIPGWFSTCHCPMPMPSWPTQRSSPHITARLRLYLQSDKYLLNMEQDLSADGHLVGWGIWCR